MPAGRQTSVSDLLNPFAISLAAGGTADQVFWRRAIISTISAMILAALSGGRDLAQHVFLEVAFGVAVLHRYVGEEIDPRGQNGQATHGLSI